MSSSYNSTDNAGYRVIHAFWQHFGRLAFWVTWPLVWVYAPLKHRSRILVVYGNEFLVVTSYFGSGQWQLPGGGVHSGESDQAAAVRELHEETGIRVAIDQVKPLVPRADYIETGIKMRYVLNVVQLSSRPDVHVQRREIADYAWVPLQPDVVSQQSGRQFSAHAQDALRAFREH